MTKKNRKWTVLTALFAVTLLSGCFMRAPDELYALPKQAEDYYDLQQAIDEVMQNASYCAPTGGDNRQAVQMKDLDGDGSNEAIVFAKTEGELPLRIFLFQRFDDAFQEIASFSADGAGFDSVQFVQIDGKGGPEMVVSRLLSDGVPQMLSVYGYVGQRVTELYSGSFRQMALTDLDGDGNNELFVLRDNPVQRQAEASVYCWENNRLLNAGIANTSCAADKILRLQTANTADGTAAVYVTQMVDEGTSGTDVFIWKKETLLNIAKHPDETLSSYPAVLMPTDLDGNGTLRLPSVLNGTQGDYLLVNWSGLNANGSRTAPIFCCHHADGAWFLTMDEAWRENLQVACEELTNGHKTVFAEQDGTPILTIFAYYGAEPETFAAQYHCFALGEKTGARYFAAIGTSTLAENLNAQILAERFHMQKDSAE